jgi:hypothetical protein
MIVLEKIEKDEISLACLSTCSHPFYELYDLANTYVSELTKVVETLNCVLSDTELNDTMKNPKLLGIERNRKLQKFITGIKSVIITVTHAFKDIDGNAVYVEDQSLSLSLSDTLQLSLLQSQ